MKTPKIKQNFDINKIRVIIEKVSIILTIVDCLCGIYSIIVSVRMLKRHTNVDDE